MLAQKLIILNKSYKGEWRWIYPLPFVEGVPAGRLAREGQRVAGVAVRERGGVAPYASLRGCIRGDAVRAG